MLCKLKRNFIAVMRLQAYLFCHCNSLILFPIFRAVGFCISEQSPISFTQHYKLQYRSCSKTKQYKVRHAKEWLMATILCSCLIYVSSDNGVSWHTATVSRSQAHSFCHWKHTLLSNELKESLRSLASQPVEKIRLERRVYLNRPSNCLFKETSFN